MNHNTHVLKVHTHHGTYLNESLKFCSVKTLSWTLSLIYQLGTDKDSVGAAQEFICTAHYGRTVTSELVVFSGDEHSCVIISCPLAHYWS